MVKIRMTPQQRREGILSLRMDSNPSHSSSNRVVASSSSSRVLVVVTRVGINSISVRGTRHGLHDDGGERRGEQDREVMLVCIYNLLDFQYAYSSRAGVLV